MSAADATAMASAPITRAFTKSLLFRVDWAIGRRMAFWNGDVAGEVKLVPREKVCVREIWQEAMPISKKLSKIKYCNCVTNIGGRVMWIAFAENWV